LSLLLLLAELEFLSLELLPLRLLSLLELRLSSLLRLPLLVLSLSLLVLEDLELVDLLPLEPPCDPGERKRYSYIFASPRSGLGYNRQLQ
jgi:hypothetical protein